MRVVGQPTGRVDARDIVTGKARYALDVAVTGALPTVVARPPTINGTVLSYDATVARSMPGVVAVTQIPTGVAVTAETFDQAMKAVPALAVSWGAGSVDGVSDADVKAKLTSAIAPFAVPPLLAQYVEGTFDFAFVNHAPMEVGSAVADVRSNSAEVWLATKSPTGAQSAVAGAVGLQTGPGDGARGPRRRLVRPADLFRPGRRSGPGVQGDRPAGEADVDPQRRHAARPDAPAQPSPDPGHLRARPTCSATSTAWPASRSISPAAAPARRWSTRATAARRSGPGTSSSARPARTTSAR